MAPQARRMAFDGHPSDSEQYGRTARYSRALLSTTAPSPPRLTIDCCPCRREGGVSVTLPYRGPLNGYASPPNVLLLSISAEHAPGDATYPTAYAPSFPAQGDLWWRAQRRPPRDRCEIRVTRLGFGIRASGVETRASLTRGRRACTWRRHLPQSACAFFTDAGRPMVANAASAAS